MLRMMLQFTWFYPNYSSSPSVGYLPYGLWFTENISSQKEFNCERKKIQTVMKCTHSLCRKQKETP